MSNMTTAQKIAADEPRDDVLDAVGDVLDLNRGVWFTPSQAARKASFALGVRVTTYEAAQALAWLERHIMAIGDGNGAWRKWRAREALEGGNLGD